MWDVKSGPHGGYFASCGRDRTARLWSQEVQRPLRIFTGGIVVLMRPGWVGLAVVGGGLWVAHDYSYSWGVEKSLPV